MSPITLPKPVKENKKLVVLTRKQYERLLAAYRWQAELDANLDQSIEQVKRGKLFGPFNSGEELLNSLNK